MFSVTYAYFAQFVQGFAPCLLCILQRLALIIIGIIFLFAAVHRPHSWAAKIYGLLIDLTAIIGMLLAVWHVWIQNLPLEKLPKSCGPSLDYMLKNLQIRDVVQQLLTVSGECANTDWNLLNISVPIWNILFFFILGMFGLVANYWTRR
jgi:disulfide bond formation protein DsbB